MNSEWGFHVRVKSLVTVCPRVLENVPQEFKKIFDICIFLQAHQNIAIYLDLSLQKHMQEEIWQDKGLHLPRQWQIVLNTMWGEMHK